MEAFLGSLNLLEKFVQQASPQVRMRCVVVHITALSLECSLQLQYSCDRGVYTFKADTISLSLSIETGCIPVLKLSVKPLQGTFFALVLFL